MSIGTYELGQGQIKAGLNAGPGAQGGAKTGGIRLGAIDRHDKSGLPAGGVGRIGVRPVAQGPVVDV